MENISQVKPLSDALSEPIVKAYKAGGFGLVFIFIGTLLLLVGAFFERGTISYIAGIFGCLMILLVLYLFYVQSIRPLKELQSQVKGHEERVNNVQQIALEMTDLAYQLQSLAFKNATLIADAITKYRQAVKTVTALPLVSTIPGIHKIGELADDKIVLKAESLAASIVETTVSTQKLIENTKKALIEPDTKVLKKYLEQIKLANAKTTEILKK